MTDEEFAAHIQRLTDKVQPYFKIHAYLGSEFVSDGNGNITETVIDAPAVLGANVALNIHTVEKAT